MGIRPCPQPEIGLGQRVTDPFHHTSGEVYDRKLASESKPLGVTARHPFWSMDRKGWVSVVYWEIGETLKTLTGTTAVQSIVKRRGCEPVYNIEVDGEHVYCVGESGVLIHNASDEEKQRQQYADCGPIGDSGVNWCGANPEVVMIRCMGWSIAWRVSRWATNLLFVEYKLLGQEPEAQEMALAHCRYQI